MRITVHKGPYSTSPLRVFVGWDAAWDTAASVLSLAALLVAVIIIAAEPIKIGFLLVCLVVVARCAYRLLTVRVYNLGEEGYWGKGNSWPEAARTLRCTPGATADAALADLLRDSQLTQLSKTAGEEWLSVAKRIAENERTGSRVSPDKYRFLLDAMDELS